MRCMEASTLALTKSRRASCVVSGTQTGVRSPCRWRIASFSESRRSVLIRSPSLRGIIDGAATVHTSPETDPSAADDDGSAGGAKKHGRSPEPTKPETSTVAGEWISSEITRAWAKIQPPLAKLDLRPYLFVAKDRK